MKIVGLTGGIGSGKTSVAHIFEVMGVPVYYSDLRARWIMENDPIVIKQLTQHFGPQSYIKQGHLNRSFISKKIFGNPSETSWLNQLIHPLVQLDFNNWAEHQTAAFGIKESALLIELRDQQKLDKLILVISDEPSKIQRIQKRDALTVQEIKSRMEAQISDADRIPYAHFIIYNEGRQSLIKQSIQIFKQLEAEYSGSKTSN